MNKDTEIMKQVISTIIPDIKHKYFNCSGDINQSGYTIDDGLAFGYYNNLKDILTEIDISFTLYGGIYKKKIQVLSLNAYSKYLLNLKDTDNDNYTDDNLRVLSRRVKLLNNEAASKSSDNMYLIEATTIFSQHIGVYLKGNIIGDDFFQLIMQALEYLDLYEIEYRGSRYIVFLPKQQVQVKTTVIDASDNTLGTNETTGSKKSSRQKKIKGVFNVLLHKHVNELDKDELRYNNIMLLIKESKDGYFDCRTHSLALKNKKGTYELHEYVIGEDIEITLNTKTNEVISVNTKETIYRSAKDSSGIWRITNTKTKETVKVSEFKNVVIEIDSDNPDIQHIKLYGAYTHVLRNILGFKPQTWQYKFLINQKRINYVAGVRRGGKTLLSSYLIIRFLYRNPTDLKHTLRQPKGIYTITSKDKFKAVLDYIEAQSNRIKVLKSLVYIKRQDRLILSDDKLDFAKTKYQDIQATYDFISAKGYKTGVGNGGDDIILDESSSIPEDVWLNLAPIVTNEGANLFCISTIDWTTPKQWFYSNLVNIERGGIENSYSQRVTIDDIDDNIMDESAKDYAKSTLKHNMPRYLGELYATFSSESQVFSSEGSIILETPTDIYEQIFIGYDPAKRSDFGAIIVVGLYKETLYVLDEYQLQGDYSTYQKQVVFDIKKKYLDKGIKTTLIMDGTSAGDVVAEIFGNIIDYKVWYTGDTSSSYKPHVDDFGSWKVSKTRLVTITQMLFETKKIKILSSLTNLQGEISTFKQYVANGKTKYDAISGEHDDLVNALMLIGFLYGYIEGKLSTLTKDNDKEFHLMNKQYIDHKTGLYKKYLKTIKTKSQRDELNRKKSGTKKVGYYF